MKKNSLVYGILAVLIFVSFFLPWIGLESPRTGAIRRILTGQGQNEMVKISGFQVPILANSPDSKLMIRVIKIFNPNINNADKKSWLIWGVPLLAVIIFLLSLSKLNARWFNLIVGLLGITIFLFGTYKITTANLDKLVLNIKVASGIWLTLWGYLGLGATGAVSFIKSLPQKKR